MPFSQKDKRLWIIVQYICVLFVTICITLLIISPLFIFLIALGGMLFIPAFVIACISFFLSLRCNTRHKKILLALNVVNIALVSLLFFGSFNKCNADIMEEHYKEYGGRMEQIYHTLYKKMTPGNTISIEFENGEISLFQISPDGNELIARRNPSEKELDWLLSQSGLEKSTLIWLEEQLNEIGCISISMSRIPNEPYCIGFRRIGMGMYSYIIYPFPLSSHEQKKINESAESIVYSPHVVFEFGGGAFGPQDFAGKSEYLKKKMQPHHE